MLFFPTAQNISNITHATVKSNIINIQQEFIKKYGNTVIDYKYLNQLGKMKNNGTIIGIFILAVILSIVAFVFSNKNPQIISRCLLRKIGWLFVIIAICVIGYGSILYFFFYLPEWYTWFKKLDTEGKVLLSSIEGLNSINNTRYNYNNTRN